MSVFSSSDILLFTALAILLTAIAAGLVLRPLLSRTYLRRTSAQSGNAQADAALMVLQEQYADLEREYRYGHISHAQWQQARQEVERRALAEGLASPAALHAQPEKAWALGSSLFVATLAIAGYLILGEPAAVIPANTAAPSSTNDADALAEMVDSLAQRLAGDSSGTPQEWTMLARSYMVLGEYGKAAEAYARLLKFEPDNADALTSHAEALLLREEGVAPLAAAQLERALQLSPRHSHALFLSGSVAFQSRDYAKAIAHWKTMLEDLDPEDPDAAYLHSLIADAQARQSP